MAYMAITMYVNQHAHQVLLQMSPICVLVFVMQVHLTKMAYVLPNVVLYMVILILDFAHLHVP